MRIALGRYAWVMMLVALVLAGNAPAYAQGGGTATTLSGVVADSSGGVLPGASIEAKENATGVTYTAVADSQGRFVIPNITPGTYTVRASLQGFKTFVAPDVRILTATPASLQARLEIGALTDNVVVTAATDVVQTQSATITSTISVNQIQKLPVITHTALDAVVFTSGVETVGSNTRGSTINGLPTTAINITLDGINAQDKRGNEGFFMMIRPMMDSVEEITVSTSTPGADASGAGGATIRMQTRSGANQFSASGYTTWRNQAGTSDSDALSRNKKPGWLWRMNTPYWFNKRDLPKTAAGDYFINDVRLQTPGFRVGGPLQKDKLFYFFNYEEFQLPESRSRTRTLLGAAAQTGDFTYLRADNGQPQTVNLLQLAGTRGLTSTPDPTISRLLADIRTATGTTGRVRNLDLNLDQYDYAPSATQLRRFPTTKIDYNLTPTQRLSGTYRYNKFNSTPDFLNNAEATFPGFAQQGTQISGRYSWQANLNSVFGKWVNEARYGVNNVTGKGTAFNGNITPETYNCEGPGCQSVGGLGYAIGLNTNNGAFGGAAMTSWGGRNPSFDVTAQYSFEDTLTYITGSHSLTFGGSWARLDYRSWAQTVHNGTLSIGMQTNDPANSVFDASTGTSVFPGGINTTNAGYAKNLYALLTGRVTSVGGTYVLQPDGSFMFHGPTIGSAVRDDFGFYASDTWRVKPNLTLTMGLRYQLEMPITTDGLYSVPEDWRQVYGITGAGDGYIGSGNLYKPGTMTGTNDLGVVRYQTGNPPYKTDYNNFAPSVQAAWRPNLTNKAFTWLVGDDPVLRGGYSTTFNKLGTNTFTGNYGANIGRTRTGTRNATSGTPPLGSDGWPVLLRDAARLVPSPAPAALGESFRLTPAINEDIDIHHPDWRTPVIHQYSFGVQRQIGRDFGVDVRYVGNISTAPWTSWDMNASPQWSIIENGYLDEFRKAQANLRANIVAGRGNTFAYTGAPGTSPLPIYMAYFAGIPLGDARNQNPANYTQAQFTNSNWYNQLTMYTQNNNNLTGMAGTGTNGLQNGLGLGTGLDVNRQLAGLPANFFMANPAIAQGNAWLEVNGGSTKFNAMQVDITKRLSRGLSVQTNYAYAFGRKTWQQRSLREDWFYLDSGAGSDHTFKANWVYELPFGQGQRFGANAGRLMNGLIGGWDVSGLMRWQSGQKFNYGNFRLVGMSHKDLQNMFKFYRRTDANGIERIYMLPEDVIQNSILAIFNTSATTATGLSGAEPTGRYLAPANGPDCVGYAGVQCPGTELTRFVTGPGYFKADMSFVKRVSLGRRINVEARMEIFNVFNTINFNATSRMSNNAVTGWDVTSAATDINASQDPGGRITQFGLRFTF